MGFVPEGPPLLDAVPGRARTGTFHLVKEHLVVFRDRWHEAYDECRKAARRGIGERGTHEEMTESLLGRCEWLEFFEIAEHIASKIKTYSSNSHYVSQYEGQRFERFRTDFNSLLADEGVGYEIDGDAKVQMNASREMVEASAAALERLTANNLTAPAEQLRRSLEKLTFRKMDPTNAVKDAVGALQGVLSARFGGKGDVGDNVARLRTVLHPTLAVAVDALVKIEAYRGDMAAHADKPDRAVSVEEAIFVVHVCSAAIALLASTANA
jgi:hypothetical protein